MIEIAKLRQLNHSISQKRKVFTSVELKDILRFIALGLVMMALIYALYIGSTMSRYLSLSLGIVSGLVFFQMDNIHKKSE